MKKRFSSKKDRKQVEEQIIKDMTQIKDNLKEARVKQDNKTDKERVMSVLTKFLKLKKGNIH